MVRLKKRYFLCNFRECKQNVKIRKDDLLKSLKYDIRQRFGIATLVQMNNLHVKYFNQETNTLIIACPRSHSNELEQVLTNFIMDSTNLKIKVIHISGTIRSSEKKLILYIKNSLRRAYYFSNCEEEKRSILEQMESIF
ncbi:hypothetical protein A3Q56_03047 [Intoshia linei]|uniref:Ribonuclease P/MRP protein subunit POP5 n=1 Tax=Intoshia linei TaxID=1819745 RepID=A0A177B702_9BILA|nr:hypothetical protein A3Q56_03047 [Intoshia linei]